MHIMLKKPLSSSFTLNSTVLEEDDEFHDLGFLAIIISLRNLLLIPLQIRLIEF